MADLKLATGSSFALVASGSAPGNAVVAAAARSDQGAEYDNSTLLEPFGQIELVLTFGTGPTAGRRVLVYAIPALNGTDYAEGSSSVTPSQSHVLGWAYVRNITTAQRLRVNGPSPDGRLHLPPCKFKILLANDTDQQISAGWSATLYPAHWASS